MQLGSSVQPYSTEFVGVENVSVDNLSGADIDALCVAPRHIERAEFFTSFIERLQSEPGIRELRVSDLLLTVFSISLYW